MSGIWTLGALSRVELRVALCRCDSVLVRIRHACLEPAHPTCNWAPRIAVAVARVRVERHPADAMPSRRRESEKSPWSSKAKTACPCVRCALAAGALSLWNFTTARMADSKSENAKHLQQLAEHPPKSKTAGLYSRLTLRRLPIVHT
ncbi:hypothetical protein DENSPDRAFT_279737 [Dentipellis sp. KUC8613]|nr:hypothetical protein DENSPDRAFT_279737 [Dentipellis sp. KUC8613]